MEMEKTQKRFAQFKKLFYAKDGSAAVVVGFNVLRSSALYCYAMSMIAGERYPLNARLVLTFFARYFTPEVRQIYSMFYSTGDIFAALYLIFSMCYETTHIHIVQGNISFETPATTLRPAQHTCDVTKFFNVFQHMVIVAAHVVQKQLASDKFLPTVSFTTASVSFFGKRCLTPCVRAQDIGGNTVCGKCSLCSSQVLTEMR